MRLRINPNLLIFWLLFIQSVYPQTFEKTILTGIPSENLSINPVFDFAIEDQSNSIQYTPKYIIQFDRIKFFNRKGELENELKIANGSYKFSTKDRNYFTIENIIKEPKSISDTGIGEWKIYNKNGELIWTDNFTKPFDSHAPEYYSSDAGNWVKFNPHTGSISFYDKEGSLLKENSLFHSYSGRYTFPQYTWSVDGDYFIIAIPGYLSGNQKSSTIILFNRDGTLLWTTNIKNSTIYQLRISPQSKWLLVGYNNESAERKTRAQQWGALLYDLSTRTLIKDVREIFIQKTAFNTEETYFTGIYKLNNNKSIIKLFDINSQRIIFSNETDNYILQSCYDLASESFIFLAGKRNFIKNKVFQIDDKIPQNLLIKDIELNSLSKNLEFTTVSIPGQSLQQNLFFKNNANSILINTTDQLLRIKK